MKKLISFVASAVLAAAPLMSSFVHAEDDYLPLLYIKAQSGYNVTSDGDVIISREDIAASENGIAVKMDVFIEDDALSSYYIRANWKSASSYIMLNQMYDPLEPENYTEYAYAETDDDGNLIHVKNDTLISVDPECNTMNFTCVTGLNFSSVGDKSPLLPYGEKSDDYPLLSFDLIVDPAAPAGKYEIYFLREVEDYPDQHYTKIHTVAKDGKPATDFIPRTQSINIIITDDSEFILGDINFDSVVDASDASLALKEYASIQTTGNSAFTELETKAADVDADGAVNAGDASLILGFYSHQQTSTNPLPTIEEWQKTLVKPTADSDKSSAVQTPPVTSTSAAVTTSVKTTTTAVSTTVASKSTQTTTAPVVTTVNSTTKAPAASPSEPDLPAAVSGQSYYVLNTNTMKFHYPSCASVKTIKAENRYDTSASRDAVTANGYVPCGKCHP